MNHAPEKLELHFTEAVQLLKFSLTGSEAAAVATEFKAAADKLEHFEIALPALKEDSYTVSWSALNTLLLTSCSFRKSAGSYAWYGWSACSSSARFPAVIVTGTATVLAPP